MSYLKAFRAVGPGLLIAGGMVLAAEAITRWAMGTPPVYRKHPSIEYLFKPNQSVWRFRNRVFINAYGMRSAPISAHPPAGARRILVFGDSVVFGGTQLDQSVIATERLVTRLEGSQPRKHSGLIQIGNVSGGSWGPGNWLGWAQTYGFLGATDVVLVISSHDVRDNPTYGPLDVDHPTETPGSALGELLGRYVWPQIAAKLSWSPLSNLSQGRGAALPSPDPASPAALRQGLTYLHRFLLLARASGARVSVVQFWEQRELVSGEPLAENREIAALLRQERIPAVQAGPLFRRCSRRADHGYDDLLVDVIHPFTAAGQTCLAEAMAQALESTAAGQQ
ncbi:hypothetical protein [Synechococcus sp. CS-1327]|uniref:hypothetical protein n=1 Tax=Synechococcus sp. CS-1327 TaxID=2847977 RepID=UPI00223BE25F|nr:hypothetical protein [Synechococcus sp. CS-1327]MCT0232997.1 hypothetical protein [Synechococcus sp. CS-1327]